ncbi:MAG: AMP-binding protein [Armatimonadetes bacterium]|nr:AMP-binding protein [Armatimonadota bacterium]
MRVTELGVLWRCGLLRVQPRQVVLILRAWWRCRNSFAFLSTTAAVRWGERVALEDDDGALTFAELHRRSLALAHRLSGEAGLRVGSQVALRASNGRGFVVGLLACTRLGADVLPLAPDLPPLVTEAILRRQQIEGLLCEADSAEAVPCWPWLSDLAQTTVEPPPVARGGQLVVLTSGTSGISKGIRRRPTLNQLLPLALGLLQSLNLRTHRPIVAALPLHHGYGLATLAMALALGSPLHVATRYEVEPLLERLDPEEAPVLVTVPTLLKRWLDGGPGETRPTTIITGSAPLDAGLCARLLAQLGPVLFNLYGSTEAGLIALAPPETLLQSPGSVGRPLPGNAVRVVDSQEQEVQPGQVGRILARGPFVLPSRPDGWRDTGDLGQWDRHGNLSVRGRADGMIVSGGENVYPYEVEEVLSSHPDVAEAVVWAVSDEAFGQRLAAAVLPRPGGKLEEGALLEWLKERLERHKRPRVIRVVAEIPRNPLGKVDRVKLRSQIVG